MTRIGLAVGQAPCARTAGAAGRPAAPAAAAAAAVFVISSRLRIAFLLDRDRPRPAW
jgi:hypothetical protein